MIRALRVARHSAVKARTHRRSGTHRSGRRDGGAAEAPDAPTTIVPTPGGPLYVRGRVRLRSADGRGLVEETRLALCRCGQSGNKPFCDNSQRAAGFADPGAVDGPAGGTPRPGEAPPPR
jgi:CDGSH-type Zn-finger protein